MVSPVAVGVVITSYLIGCLTAGYYLVRLRTGEDIRAAGSGSAGARNVGRRLGAKGFAVTLALDALKGAVAIVIATEAGLSDAGVAAAFVAVVAGHIWPAQLRFRGGKGMATAAGAMLAFDPPLFLAAFAVTAIVFSATRHATLAGLAGVASAPIAAIAAARPVMDLAGVAVVAVFVIAAHRSNIQALRKPRSEDSVRRIA